MELVVVERSIDYFHIPKDITREDLTELTTNVLRQPGTVFAEIPRDVVQCIAAYLSFAPNYQIQVLSELWEVPLADDEKIVSSYDENSVVVAKVKPTVEHLVIRGREGYNTTLNLPNHGLPVSLVDSLTDGIGLYIPTSLRSVGGSGSAVRSLGGFASGAHSTADPHRLCSHTFVPRCGYYSAHPYTKWRNTSDEPHAFTEVALPDRVYMPYGGFINGKVDGRGLLEEGVQYALITTDDMQYVVVIVDRHTRGRMILEIPTICQIPSHRVITGIIRCTDKWLVVIEDYVCVYDIDGTYLDVVGCSPHMCASTNSFALFTLPVYRGFMVCYDSRYVLCYKLVDIPRRFVSAHA